MSGGTREEPRGLFVSVDVDSLYLYLALYGRAGENEAALVEQTYLLGVRRFLGLFAEFDLPATFFVVGRDLDHDAARTVAREAVAAGHHLGNHTLSHPYDLIRLPHRAAREEIEGGHAAIRELTGRAPAVFRAPGYNMTAREYGMLEGLGYRYDASPLPSYPYLLLKYAVMTAVRLQGRRSRSIWGNPAAFLGPREPYPRGALTVLPCAATPWLRLPIIGTSLSTAPRPLFEHFLATLRRQSFVGLEFHAVDLMALESDPLPAPLAAQKDLHVPLARKVERYRELLSELRRTLTPFAPE